VGAGTAPLDTRIVILGSREGDVLNSFQDKENLLVRDHFAALPMLGYDAGSRHVLLWQKKPKSHSLTAGRSMAVSVRGGRVAR
jgi:hypothetical protein